MLYRKRLRPIEAESTLRYLRETRKKLQFILHFSNDKVEKGKAAENLMWLAQQEAFLLTLLEEKSNDDKQTT